jgi:hypothetical protein
MKNLNLIKSRRRRRGHRRGHPVDPDSRRGTPHCKQKSRRGVLDCKQKSRRGYLVDPDCRRKQTHCKQKSRRGAPDCKQRSRRRPAQLVGEAGIRVKDGFIKDSTYYEYRYFIERITREYLQRLIERENRINRGEPRIQNITRPIIPLPEREYRGRSNAFNEEDEDNEEDLI